MLAGGSAWRRHPRDPPMSREQPQPLVRRRRLRRDRREAVWHTRGRPIPPGIRRRAVRNLRATALYTERKNRSARIGKFQGAAHGRSRGIDEENRRSLPLRPAGKPGAQPAVRLRFDCGRKLNNGRPAVGQTEAGRRYRPQSLDYYRLLTPISLL